MNYTKLTYTEQNDLVEREIEQYFIENDIVDDCDSRASIINLLQNLGVEFDGCSSCGSMPMTTNCNNSRCQDL